MSAHPSQAGHLSVSHPVPQPATPLSLSNVGWQPSAHYNLKQKPLALGTCPLPKGQCQRLLSLCPPITVPTFNSTPGEEQESLHIRSEGGSLPSAGLYSPFAKVKKELGPFRKG